MCTTSKNETYSPSRASAGRLRRLYIGQKTCNAAKLSSDILVVHIMGCWQYEPGSEVAQCNVTHNLPPLPTVESDSTPQHELPQQLVRESVSPEAMRARSTTTWKQRRRAPTLFNRQSETSNGVLRSQQLTGELPRI